jgi:hypothetical protein
MPKEKTSTYKIKMQMQQLIAATSQGKTDMGNK